MWIQKHLMAMCIGSIVVTTGAYAQTDSAATVHFVRGDVTAIMSGQTDRALHKSDRIYRKERIETGGQSRIQMRFTDGGLVSLMADSVFVVEDYFYKEGETETAIFGLLKGGLRTVSGAIGKVRHEDYQLKTPVATLGIRGTQYTAVLFPADTLRVHVGEGRIVLTNDHGTLDVTSGQSAEVTLETAPRLSEEPPVDLGLAPSPLPTSPSLAQGLESDAALGVQNDHRDIVGIDGRVIQDSMISVSDPETLPGGGNETGEYGPGDDFIDETGEYGPGDDFIDETGEYGPGDDFIVEAGG